MTASCIELAAALREVSVALPLDFPGNAPLGLPPSYEADRATKQLWWQTWKMHDRSYIAGELLVGLAGTAAAIATCLPPHARPAAAELLRLAANAVEPVAKAPA